MPPRTSSKSATPTPKPAALEKEPVVLATQPPAAKKAAAVPPVLAKPVDAVAPAPEAPVVDESSALDELATKFTALAALFKEAQASLKNLTKDYERMKKIITKSEKKRANARTNPNGFAKPTKITDALCVFLGVPAGTEMSRTDVTRKINLYIKEHNLNKADNKRIIVPDDKLRAILGVKPTEEVSFFSLQRFLSPLFVKKVVAVA